MKPILHTLLWSLCSLSLLAAASLTAQARPPSEESIKYFRQNCSSCHTIGGGRLAGPDLKDVGKRRDRKWLTKFIKDPKGVIDSGDPYAQKIYKEARTYMQAIPGITDARIAKLLDLIDAESVAKKPLFAGAGESKRPLTAADIILGDKLFRGETSFESKAPPCISCHTVSQLGGLGGGRLGPDLTTAYSRLEGRRALSAWLSAPPSIVMQPIYAKHPINEDERLALIAYLKKSAEAGDEFAKSVTMQFLLAGLLLAALILVLFDYLWRFRYRAVRRPLVESLTR